MRRLSGWSQLHLGPDLVVEDLGAEPDAPRGTSRMSSAPHGSVQALPVERSTRRQLARRSRGRRGPAAGAWRSRGRLLTRLVDQRSVGLIAEATRSGAARETATGRPEDGLRQERARSCARRRRRGLTSKGLRRRCAFQAERSTPDWTSPFSMPTSLVVQMSLAGPADDRAGEPAAVEEQLAVRERLGTHRRCRPRPPGRPTGRRRPRRGGRPRRCSSARLPR